MINKKKIIVFIPSRSNYSRFFELSDLLGKSSNFYFTKREINAEMYLPIVVNTLEDLEDENFINNKYIIKYKFNENMNFIFDCSIEAITLSDQTSEILIKFHKIIKKLDIDSKRITILNANYKSKKFYKEWAGKNNIQEKINLIGYNFYLYEYYSEILFSNFFKKNYINFQNKSLEKNHDRKKFMSLCLRPRWHRKAITLFLLSMDYIKDGIVSYFGETFGNNDSKTVNTSNESNNKIKLLQKSDLLLDKVIYLDQLSPIIYERDIKKIKKDLWDRKKGEINFLIPEITDDDNYDYIQSYFEIVSETWLTDGRCLYFTEKILRPILRSNFFIIAGSPYTLKYFNEIGFKTFSPYINEDYDSVECPEKRMDMVLNEVERICSMSDEKLKKLYDNIEKQIIHNYKFLLNGIELSFENEINTNIVPHLESTELSLSKIFLLLDNFRAFSYRKHKKNNYFKFKL